MPFPVFAGFFVKLKDVPFALKVVSYFSYARYMFESNIIALYGYGRCAQSKTVGNESAVGQQINDEFWDNLEAFVGRSVVKPVIDETQSTIMSQFGFADDMLNFNISMLVCYTLGLQVFTYLVFVYKLKRN